MLVCAIMHTFGTRDRGCSRHPAFPAPSVLKRANEFANLGQNVPREGRRACLMIVSRTRCSASSALLRRAGTHPFARTMDPGSAAHHAARHSASKTRVNALVALRSIRGTQLMCGA